MRSVRDEGTYFLNVDLDIFSRSDLQPLVSAFGDRVLVLYVGRERRRHGAHLEMQSSGYAQGPDVLIRRFVALVENLPRPARKLWNGSFTREFNIGIQAAQKPPSYELRLQPETLKAAASVKAGIVITVYGAAPAVTPATIGDSKKGKLPIPRLQRTLLGAPLSRKPLGGLES